MSDACVQDAEAIAEKLAPICNAILFQNDTGSYVCSGFNYNMVTNVAYFKAQLLGEYITADSLCNSPNVTTWLLETGRSMFNVFSAYTNVII